MTKMLIVIPFTTDNAVLAERLCDWIFQLAGRTQRGSAILVCDQQVHAELRQKVRIAADVAFSSVDEVATGVQEIPTQIPVHYWTNLMFLKAAEHVQKNYRWPWLWLEPECVPLRAHWLEAIMNAYDAQGRRYMGTHMKLGDHMFMARVGVYPASTIYDLRELKGDSGPFELELGAAMIPRSSKSRVFQQLKIRDEMDIPKIREDAALVVGDSTGILIESMRESAPPESIPIPVTSTPRIDGRTRAGRAQQAALKGTL